MRRYDGRPQSEEEPVPLQNRVTPFGEIVAIPQRGTLMGNRGIIHDPRTRTLLRRRWSTKAWIACVCDYRGVRRQVMAGRSWTELFFLDEATALAAGHRPCFFCRREAAERKFDGLQQASGYHFRTVAGAKGEPCTLMRVNSLMVPGSCQPG